ncbi:HD domain-containing phosphohydrolase [Aliivibrio sifiae]|uniref:HD domain-containing phosphohydrolase n=1 Tax=Aliivibrio sifiae TaxID=566293 RepID=UPI003D0F371F
MMALITKIKDKLIFPLHIHISTLFILMVVIICSIQILLTNKSINNLLLDANSTIFERISTETRSSIRSEYRPAFRSVSIFTKRDIINTETLAQRSAYFNEFAMLLDLHKHVSTYRITFPNGDWLGIGILGNSQFREKLTTPDNTYYFFINHTSGKANKTTIFFYDEQARFIRSNILNGVQYDPRKESWFKESIKEKALLSKPRYFPGLQQFGLSIHQKAANNVVVSADILMHNINHVLKSTSIHPSSLRALYDEENIIYASNSPRLSLMKDKESSIIKLDDLFSSEIVSTIKNLHLDQEIQRYQHKGEDWYGKIFSVPINSERSLNLLIAVKASELLSSAYIIRQQTILWSLGILFLAIPCVYFISQRISKPIRQATMQVNLMSKFDFSSINQTPTKILEISNLKQSITDIKSTIENYFNLTNSISKENDFDELIKLVGRSTAKATKATAAYLYLINDKETHIEPQFAWRANTQSEDISELESFALDDEKIAKTIEHIMIEKKPFENLNINRLDKQEQKKLGLNIEQVWSITFPLFSREKKTIGAMVLVFDVKNSEYIRNTQLNYFESLMNYTAIALDGRKMLQNQKDLLESFIQIMASAIDTKSPYTGNHCQKVPQLTQWLAQVASDSFTPPFNNFKLNGVQQEELRIASWLHDCGKITTPEYVVDKATKLETIYNRIHEIRTRFEVLKRDAEIKQWKQAFNNPLPDEYQKELEQEWQRLNEEFALIARVNVGDEFLSEQDVKQIQKIGQQTWEQTLDNSLGLAWEEKTRLNSLSEPQLPITVTLLQNNQSHLIPNSGPINHDKRFILQVPEYKNNIGEIYNLSIQRGTLNNEERFIINDHIIQTIHMLEALPFPRTMKNIPQIAGGHHEKVDGTGYPMGLKAEEMPLTARVMAIADIFEALTSHDRPYKKAKTLTESLKIMSFMVKDKHIDKDLFNLFLTSGLYNKYAEAYLKPEQRDNVDINDYIS